MVGGGHIDVACMICCIFLQVIGGRLMQQPQQRMKKRCSF